MKAGLASRRPAEALRAGWSGSAPLQGVPDRPGAKLLPDEGREEGIKGCRGGGIEGQKEGCRDRGMGRYRDRGTEEWMEGYGGGVEM